jgi:hypothetical protein
VVWAVILFDVIGGLLQRRDPRVFVQVTAPVASPQKYRIRQEFNCECIDERIMPTSRMMNALVNAPAVACAMMGFATIRGAVIVTGAGVLIVSGCATLG